MNNSNLKNTDRPPSNEQAPNYRKDYAEFLDLAVHELDSPLRKLNVLVEKLGEKYESGQVEQGRDYLKRAQASLLSIRSLIDSLYQLSLLDSEDMLLAECDTSGLMNEAISDVKSSNRNKAFVFSQNTLPSVFGDVKQIRRLFREILDNATRFAGDKVEIRVDITSRSLTRAELEELHLSRERNYIKLVIQDNGIGFAKEDAQRIFEPFVRLNGRSEYPGNGVGLAICNKIVGKHHGIIYAEPNDYEGSSFHIILPQSLN